jgi:integrase
MHYLQGGTHTVPINRLSALALRSLKPKAKPYKVFDGEGLYIFVRPSGALWQMAYRFAGRPKTLSFGAYPRVSLADARAKRDQAKGLLSENRDPIVVMRRIPLGQPKGVTPESFEAVAREWHATKKAEWKESYAELVMARMEQNLFPELGHLHVAAIDPPVLLDALRKVEARGTGHVSKKVRQHAGQVFRFAIGTGRAKRDPSADLKGVLKSPPRSKNHASLKASELETFFIKLAMYDGTLQTRLGLEFIVRTMVRTVEARFARWAEFESLDKSAALWRIPADRLKMGLEHLVPLSPQAVELLRKLRKVNGDSDYVFPNQQESSRSTSPVVSENTFLFALYRMGYHSKATVHGFRSTASTILNEHEFNPDWIERQLAHADSNAIRGIYNSAEWLSGRRKMMCWWSDYLDSAKEASNLIG